MEFSKKVRNVSFVIFVAVLIWARPSNLLASGWTDFCGGDTYCDSFDWQFVGSHPAFGGEDSYAAAGSWCMDAYNAVDAECSGSSFKGYAATSLCNPYYSVCENTSCIESWAGFSCSPSGEDTSTFYGQCHFINWCIL